jgi:hypothetical protein
LLVGEDAADMAARQNVQSSSLAIGRIEVDTKCQNASERVWAWLCDRDATCDAMAATVVNMDGQDSILVNGNSPIGGRLLVEEGSVDRESIRPETRSGKQIEAGRFQLGTEFGNRLKQVAGSEDQSGRMSCRSGKAARIEQLEEPRPTRFRDRIRDDVETLLVKRTPHV